MAAISKLSVTNVFADDTTIKITVDNIKPSNLNTTQIEAIRAKVKAFNAASGGDLAPKMKSKNGFNWVGIKAVTITTTDRNYIF